eukprot:gene11261-22374_t
MMISWIQKKQNASSNRDKILCCNSVTVFSETSSCRQGHCITGRSLVSGTSWDGNNLCDNSAAASAFSVIAILLMVYYLRLTLLQQLVCGVPSFEGAAWVSFFSGLCSMICVAIWSNWANVMNKEMGDLREKDTDRISFSNLKAGLGVWLQVIAWISLWVNTVLCALASKQVAPAAGSDGNTAQLSTGEQGGQGAPYALPPSAAEANPKYFAVGSSESQSESKEDDPLPTLPSPIPAPRRSVFVEPVSSDLSQTLLGGSSSGAVSNPSYEETQAPGRPVPVPAARPSSMAPPPQVMMRPPGLGARYSGRRSSLSDV